MQRHRSWQRLVEACVDGELSRWQDDAARRHLAECPDCGQHARVLLALRDALHRLPHLLPVLTPRRLERLATELHRNPQPGRPARRTGFPAHGT